MQGLDSRLVTVLDKASPCELQALIFLYSSRSGSYDLTAASEWPQG